MAQHNTSKPDIRVPATTETLQADLTNIAKNKGLTRTDFLRAECRKIADSYPEPTDLKPTTNHKEIAIYGMPAPIKSKLARIAKSMNIELSSFLKVHFHQLSNSYPPHMKKPPLDY